MRYNSLIDFIIPYFMIIDNAKILIFDEKYSYAEKFFVTLFFVWRHSIFIFHFAGKYARIAIFIA